MNSFLVKLAARVGRWSVLRLRQREKTHSVLMCGSCCSTFALTLRLQEENVSSEFQEGT